MVIAKSAVAGPPIKRREMLLTGLAGVGGSLLRSPVTAAAQATAAPAERTEFQIACMTLPYSGFSWERALQGIQTAGYRFVAWGTTHRASGGEERQSVLAPDATPATARALAKQCRDHGLEPLMMFSMIYPEHPQGLPVLTQRLKQASAAGVPQVLTFGHTEGGNRPVWLERFKQLGPIARDHGVTLVVKQHGGTTGTGAACAEIIREVDDPGIRVNYDAGNVMDYLNVDPLPDIRGCADVVHSLCIKDHRNWPQDQDCGPGYGEIDHYRLLQAVAWLGRQLPLCCENIFRPLVPRPQQAESIDLLARHAREYLEAVVEGLNQLDPPSAAAAQ